MAQQYGLPRKTGFAPGTPSNMPALDYLALYGGHATVLKDGKKVHVHPGTAGAYGALNPELAARLHAAGKAYTQETGKTPQYGEASRGNDVQRTYWEESGHGKKYAAAPPGRSQHQKGGAMDLPDGEFRQWLNKGNKERFGLHFPVRGDAPHVQANPEFKGTFATGTASAGAAPGTAVPEVQAGAGPAAVAAARTADTKAATTPSAAAAKDPNMMKQAFLNTLLRGEAPKGAYSMINGGGKMADLSQMPTGTKAAGQYQFLPSTFAEEAKKYGYKDFKEGTQDTAAWNYARDSYTQKTGRRLEDDLASNDPKVLNNISTALAGKWPSLPGGDQPNSNWAGKDFASVYQSNLGGSGTTTEYPDPTPNVGAGASDYSAPNADLPTSAPADTSVSTSDATTAITGKPHNYGKDVGDIFSGFADIMAKGPVAQNAAAKSSPATIAMPTPMPGSISPTVDPRVADTQRQQLAMALQKLNSGRLV